MIIFYFLSKHEFFFSVRTPSHSPSHVTITTTVTKYHVSCLYKLFLLILPSTYFQQRGEKKVYLMLVSKLPLHSSLHSLAFAQIFFLFFFVCHNLERIWDKFTLLNIYMCIKKEKPRKRDCLAPKSSTMRICVALQKIESFVLLPKSIIISNILRMNSSPFKV